MIKLKSVLGSIVFCIIFVNSIYAGFFDDVLKGVSKELNSSKDNTSQGYLEVLLFKTIDIDFQKQLLGKPLKTMALFKSIEQRPKSGPGVQGWVNIKFCDPKQNTMCDDLFLLKQNDFEKAYELTENEAVILYGTIQPKPGYFGGHFRIDKIERQNK